MRNIVSNNYINQLMMIQTLRSQQINHDLYSQLFTTNSSNSNNSNSHTLNQYHPSHFIRPINNVMFLNNGINLPLITNTTSNVQQHSFQPSITTSLIF